MGKNLIRVLVAACVGMLMACSSDDSDELNEKWRPIIVEAKGIVLTPSSDGFVQSAAMPSGGGHFTIVVNSENESRVNAVSIDDKALSLNQDWSENVVTTEPICSGTWGEVAYLTAKSPYEISVTLNPNESSDNRNLEISISGVYERVSVIVSQTGE